MAVVDSEVDFTAAAADLAAAVDSTAAAAAISTEVEAADLAEAEVISTEAEAYRELQEETLMAVPTVDQGADQDHARDRDRDQGLIRDQDQDQGLTRGRDQDLIQDLMDRDQDLTRDLMDRISQDQLLARCLMLTTRMLPITGVRPGIHRDFLLAQWQQQPFPSTWQMLLLCMTRVCFMPRQVADSR